MAQPPRKGPNDGTADPSRRAAAAAAYGEQLGEALREDAALELDDDQPDPQSSSQRASLEPVPEDAHSLRRIPTQPELLSEALAAASTPRDVAPLAAESSDTPSPSPSPEPVLRPNRSPAPRPERQGLFASDRLTNLLAGAAIGMALTIIPAKKLAAARAQSLLDATLLELETSINRPLAVEDGQLRSPQEIAGSIEQARDDVRNRYLLIWLLGGLPLGLGFGLIPRWWE